MAIPHILLLSGNLQKKTVAGYVGSSSGMTPRAEVIPNMRNGKNRIFEKSGGARKFQKFMISRKQGTFEKFRGTRKS